MADPDCLFCGIVAGTIPSETIDSDERTIAFMDINPATTGHALVIPREHSADLMEIGEEDLEATALAAQRLARRMKDVLGADGINLINACGAVAWQTVFHFHIHVVPRYEADPLKLPWIPEPGDSNEITEVANLMRGRSAGEAEERPG
jgi:histidine triad (HIT) family protein